MRVLLSTTIASALLLTPSFAQDAATTPEPGAAADVAGPAAEPIPGQAILTEALEKGGFTDVRLVGQGFFLLEATAPEGGTVYLLISEKGAPIAAGEGEPAPDFSSEGTAESAAEETEDGQN